jgi:hypothetical protein
MQLMQLMLQGGGAELLHQLQINKNGNNTSQRHASYSQLKKLGNDRRIFDEPTQISFVLNLPDLPLKLLFYQFWQRFVVAV